MYSPIISITVHLLFEVLFFISYNYLDLPSLESIMLGLDAFHESLNTIIEGFHITLM